MVFLVIFLFHEIKYERTSEIIASSKCLHIFLILSTTIITMTILLRLITAQIQIPDFLKGGDFFKTIKMPSLPSNSPLYRQKYFID